LFRAIGIWQKLKTTTDHYETVGQMNVEELKSLSKVQIPLRAKHLDRPEIDFLIRMLEEKDDATRYNTFLLLQASSQDFPFTYEHWDTLEKKLENPNSYQRSIGLMLITENVKWDKEGKFDKTLDKYLRCCMDEKFITTRQAIQGLAKVLKSTRKYDNRISQSLKGISLTQYKENQQRLLNKDISSILKMIETRQP